MASWKQQALIEAPVDEVWALLEDPRRFPEWNTETTAVTGIPTKIEKGSSFDVTGRSRIGLTMTTTFKVEELEEMREIKLRCQTSGWYSHWLLTEARGQTFTEFEMGVERIPGMEGRIAGAIYTKRYLRRAADHTLDALRRVLTGRSAAAPATRK